MRATGDQPKASIRKWKLKRKSKHSFVAALAAACLIRRARNEFPKLQLAIIVSGSRKGEVLISERAACVPRLRQTISYVPINISCSAARRSRREPANRRRVIKDSLSHASRHANDLMTFLNGISPSRLRKSSSRSISFALDIIIEKFPFSSPPVETA